MRLSLVETVKLAGDQKSVVYDVEVAVLPWVTLHTASPSTTTRRKQKQMCAGGFVCPASTRLNEILYGVQLCQQNGVRELETVD